ncbi:response regulator [Marinoscillum sp.]|uniref:response regulator n=1 Tax=Marinoscillum sp. TaxID=2024838 RepID=UPI003BAA1CFE
MKKKSFLIYLIFSVFSIDGIAQVEKGQIDLREFDVQKTYSLDGDYYFYWKQLLSPDAISSTEQLFQFPALWNGQVMDGDTLEATGYATYVTTVLLDTSIQYTMHVEDMYTAFTIYFNGQVIAKNGVVADRQEDYMPCWKPVFVPITSVQDTNQLVIQVANFTHSKGGALEGLEIGERQSMADKELELVAYDLLLTGSLIMGGLFFLGLYFFGRHDKSILFFSLFCIVYSYRIAGFGYYTLHSLVDLPWSVTTRLEYITLFLSVFLFGRFVHNLYPTEARKIIWDFIGGLSLLFIAITLITPPTIYTLLVEPFFVILLAYILLTLVIYVRAKIHKRPGSGFALFSTAIVFVVFAYNILVYFGWLDEWMAASFWGYILFFFSQSLILSYRFAYFLKNAKDDALKAAQAKSDFLSTISHEIRTPLNAVVGMSHYLLQDKPGDHQIQNLTSLRYSAQHLTALINDILDYNKLESGTVSFEEQATELPDLLHGIQLAYQPKAVEKGLNLFLEVDANLDEAVYVDRTRLSQVLNNLIDNAIKFTRQGTVTVKATKVDQDLGKVKVLFEVEDTGIGIPKDKEKIIFERFMQASSSTTREFGGTGLGLAIIKKLLELQGSRIDLRSVEGEGSVFSFTQWYKTGKIKQASANHQPSQKDIKSLKNKKVLLVEDNPTNVMVAGKFLSHWQMSMEVAENGAEGLSMARENVYDVILMDLQMPVMDGYEASREIRTAGITTPIIALTASALLQVKEKVLMAGMNDYLTKPFDPEELKRKLLKNIH